MAPWCICLMTPEAAWWSIHDDPSFKRQMSFSRWTTPNHVFQRNQIQKSQSHDRFYPTSKWSYQEQFQFIRNSLKLIETFGFRPTELCSFKTQLSFTVDRRDAAVAPLPRTLSTHHFWEGIKEEDIVKSHNQKIIFKFFSPLELNFSCIQTAKPTDYSKNSMIFTLSLFKSLQNWSLFKLISKPFSCEWWNQSKSWKCQFLSSFNCNKRIKKNLACTDMTRSLFFDNSKIVRKPYYLIYLYI